VSCFQQHFPPAELRGASRAVNPERGNHVSPSDPLLWGEHWLSALATLTLDRTKPGTGKRKKHLRNYRGARKSARNTPRMTATRTFNSRYRSLFWWQVFVQFILFLLAGLSLDMGEMFRSFLCAAFAYWTIALIIVLRRPQLPTKGDFYFLRWALPTISLLCLFIVLSLEAKWR
jgi:hypothetical protein